MWKRWKAWRNRRKRGREIKKQRDPLHELENARTALRRAYLNQPAFHEGDREVLNLRAVEAIRRAVIEVNLAIELIHDPHARDPYGRAE